jgi:hypothetical protein
MSYVTWRIDHTAYNNGAYDGVTTTLDKAFAPVIRVGLGDIKDTFSFSITNKDGEYSNFFQPMDRILIYRVVNSDTINTSTDLLISGRINKYPVSLQENGRIIKVSGYNFSESTMNALVFTDPSTAGKTIDVAIKEALESVKSFNPNFSVTWDDNNPTEKSNGDPFPVVSERFFYKPLRSLLEKYSSNVYTTDGTYLWYVTKDNKLVWRRKDSIVDYKINTSEDIFNSIDEKRDTNGVVNFVVVRGGTDPKNRQLQTRVTDPISMARYGLKYKFLVDENKYSKDINDKDMALAGDSEGLYGRLPGNIPGFSYGSFITSWGSTPTSDDDYVDLFRTHVKDYLKLMGSAYIELRRFGKFGMDLTVPVGMYGWNIGDVIEYKKVTNGFTSTKALRIMEVQYGTKQDLYTLEEDIGTLK